MKKALALLLLAVVITSMALTEAHEGEYKDTKYDDKKHGYPEKHHDKKDTYGEKKHDHKDTYGEKKHEDKDTYGEKKHVSKGKWGKLKLTYGKKEDDSCKGWGYKDSYGKKDKDSSKGYGKKVDYGKKEVDSSKGYGKKVSYGKKEYDSSKGYGKNKYSKKDYDSSKLTCYSDFTAKDAKYAYDIEFVLTFDWAARDGLWNQDSNRFAVYFNGRLVRSFLPKDYKLHHEKIIIKGRYGKNRLDFVGKGVSDSYGAQIDNVKLVRKTKYGSKNYIKNGDFESGHNLGIGGWFWYDDGAFKGWRSVGQM